MGRAARERRGGQAPNRPPASQVRPAVLGVDIGGVLVDRVSEESDTSFFGDRPLETPAVAGAFAGLQELAALFEYRIHIVSKAGSKIAGLSRRWLEQHHVFDGTSVPASNLHFVRKRPDKHEVCERLHITHFADDRLDVLEHLRGVPSRYLFIGGLGSHPAPSDVPPEVTIMDIWPLLVSAVRRSIAR